MCVCLCVVCVWHIGSFSSSAFSILNISLAFPCTRSDYLAKFNSINSILIEHTTYLYMTDLRL